MVIGHLSLVIGHLSLVGRGNGGYGEDGGDGEDVRSNDFSRYPVFVVTTSVVSPVCSNDFSRYPVFVVTTSVVIRCL
ncbi:MAG: hypothetical protein ACRC8Y_01845 [Chroococcales cyanobacterium]